MAGYQLSRGAMMSLANETLMQITGYLDEPDILALSLVNRRLNTVAGPALWNGLYNDSLRSKEVLLWAVEVGRPELVQQQLERGVSPDFLYLSSILRSRLLDVFAVQGRRGTAGPREDRTLRKEIFREKYCRNAQMRKRVRYFSELLRNKVPMEQDLDYYFDANLGYYGHACALDRFGVIEKFEASETPNYWAWGPIHVAVILGDVELARLLLEHGADVNAQCSGLCDCAAPGLTGEDEPNESVAPHKMRSVWTPLHVAMCSGNEEMVRLLISHGASTFVGSLVTQSAHLNRKARLAITAFQNAAWIGSTRICRILLDTDRRFRKDLDRINRRKQTALHYAAAGGHVQTVGRLLLENGATFHHYEDSNTADALRREAELIGDPIRQLCMQFRYGEARWLLHFCRRLYIDKPVSTVQLCTRVLASLCFLREPAIFSRLSLREKQDKLYRLSSLSPDHENLNREKDLEASWDSRLALARELLDLGAADPNQAVQADFYGLAVSSTQRVSFHRTPLQLAARSGFGEMVDLLVCHGANCNLKAARFNSPKELPLLLAVKYTLGHGHSERGLRAVQSLLDAGASFDDCGSWSILCAMNSLRNFRWDSEATTQTWHHIAEMFLSRGAADKVGDWESVIEDACVPGNLRYCKMLEAARPTPPIRSFSWRTLAEMLKNVVTGLNPGRNAAVGFEGKGDSKMVSWVLSHAELESREERICFKRSVRNLLKLQFLNAIPGAPGAAEIEKLLEEFLVSGKRASAT
jgi:ankyrin repeat protein